LYICSHTVCICLLHTRTSFGMSSDTTSMDNLLYVAEQTGQKLPYFVQKFTDEWYDKDDGKSNGTCPSFVKWFIGHLERDQGTKERLRSWKNEAEIKRYDAYYLRHGLIMKSKLNRDDVNNYIRAIILLTNACPVEQIRMFQLTLQQTAVFEQRVLIHPDFKLQHNIEILEEMPNLGTPINGAMVNKNTPRVLYCKLPYIVTDYVIKYEQEPKPKKFTEHVQDLTQRDKDQKFYETTYSWLYQTDMSDHDRQFGDSKLFVQSSMTAERIILYIKYVLQFIRQNCDNVQSLFTDILQRNKIENESILEYMNRFDLSFTIGISSDSSVSKKERILSNEHKQIHGDITFDPEAPTVLNMMRNLHIANGPSPALTETNKRKPENATGSPYGNKHQRTTQALLVIKLSKAKLQIIQYDRSVSDPKDRRSVLQSIPLSREHVHDIPMSRWIDIHMHDHVLCAHDHSKEDDKHFSSVAKLIAVPHPTDTSLTTQEVKIVHMPFGISKLTGTKCSNPGCSSAYKGTEGEHWYVCDGCENEGCCSAECFATFADAHDDQCIATLLSRL